MSEDNAFIIATDYLIQAAPEREYFYPRDILVNFGFVEKGFKDKFSSIDWEQISMNRFEPIIQFIEDKGYIEPRGNGSYRLNDLGREVRRKGGHEKYWDWINEKDNAIRENIKYASQSAEAARESADAAKNSVFYNKRTMQLIAIYTGLTLIIAVATVWMCSQNRVSKSIQSKAAVSTNEAKANKLIDTIR